MYDFYMIMKILPWFCLGILTITFVILEVLDFRRRGGQGGTGFLTDKKYGLTKGYPYEIPGIGTVYMKKVRTYRAYLQEGIEPHGIVDTDRKGYAYIETFCTESAQAEQYVERQFSS